MYIFFLVRVYDMHISANTKPGIGIIVRDYLHVEQKYLILALLSY